MGASSDLVQPFRPRQKNWSLGWEKNRLSRYDTRAEGALPLSITVIARLKNSKNPIKYSKNPIGSLIKRQS